jgi:hypothetical protein
LNAPAKLCTEYIKNFKKYLFDRPRIRRILDIPGDNSRRLLLLDESLLKEKVAEMPGDVILPEDLKIFNNQHGVTLEYYNLAVGYEHTPMDEVLKKLLPSAITERIEPSSRTDKLFGLYAILIALITSFIVIIRYYLFINPLLICIFSTI